MGLLAEEELGVVLEIPLLLEAVNLLNENLGVHHHPVADDTPFSLMEDARGDEVKNEFLPLDHESVAGVIPPLKADDYVGVLGQ